MGRVIGNAKKSTNVILNGAKRSEESIHLLVCMIFDGWRRTGGSYFKTTLQLSAVIICVFLPAYLFAQSSSSEDLNQRKSKIEDIYRIQDTRSSHNGTLLNYLSDRDPVVRQTATNALGSMEDTSLVQLMITNLLDNDPNVAYTAAFAIGQTATQLSKKAREDLQHDLIWVRYDQVQMKNQQAADRLVEELGKFGTEDALRDLMLKFGASSSGKVNLPLVMSIARFAIRNIVRQEATLYLVSLAKNYNDVPWQVVYALQRVGNNPDIKNNLADLIPLYHHSDPLARMHFATLLGKIHDAESSIDPLEKMAEFDNDWRVRVNALRALSVFPTSVHEDIVDEYRRSFFDKTQYVGLAAIEILGTTDLKDTGTSQIVTETFTRLREISVNKDNAYLWYYQAAAAGTLAKLSGSGATDYIIVNDKQDKLLQAALLSALGRTGDKKVAPILESYLTNEDTRLVRTAIEGLSGLAEKHPNDTDLVDKTYQTCLHLLNTDDVAIVTTAGEILGDSVFQESGSVQPLVDKLSHLRVPYDIEAMQSICSTLGKLGNKQAVHALEDLLDTPDRSVVLAAVSALQEITGNDYHNRVPDWIQPLYTDFDFSYLHSLPDTINVTMETTRGDIQMLLYKNVAPFTVMSFLKLSSQKGFFRGLMFHRVVVNFVIQGGDPRGDGWGGPGYAIRSEFSPLTYGTGTVGMASSGKDTEGSQFFITQSPQPHLDGKYTIFGQVTSGMDVVNTIRVDDRILDIQVAK